MSPPRLLWALCLPHAISGALLRQAAQEDKGYGKLLYLKLFKEGLLDVFALQLRGEAVDRGEILWARDWETVPLDLCDGPRNFHSCSEIVSGASKLNESAKMYGHRISHGDLPAVTELLLKKFSVDIFFHTTQLGLYGDMYAKQVLDRGPVAVMETDGLLGEHRLFASTLTLMLSLKKTLLVMAYEGNAHDHKELGTGLERTIRRTYATRPPLMYCWTKDGYPDQTCDELTGFPAECTLRSQQYWGGSPAEIHATPDVARGATETALAMPVLIAQCHAPPPPPPPPVEEELEKSKPSYILYYDNSPNHAANLTRARLIYKATGLEVQVLAKRSQEHCDTRPARSEGVHCMSKARGVAQFHSILRKARIVVAPVAAVDNPALLEATACGTPVLVERGQHQMLEHFEEEPYVTVWDDWLSLSRGLKRAMKATKTGDHKLQSWLPEAVQFPVMLERMNEFLKTARDKCDRLQ